MTLEQIIAVFCEENNVEVKDVCGGVKSFAVWTTRYMIWHYLHIEHSYSANKLSKIFNRNRPSVFRGIRIIKNEMELYKEVKCKYESIVNKIKEGQ